MASKIDNEEAKLSASAFDTSVKRPFLEKLKENISDRFKNNNVMEAFGKFASYVELQREAELSKSVTILTEQFGLDNDETQVEVTDNKHYIDCLQPAAAAAGQCNFLGILV